MLTQLLNGDWIELASIVHVTATEIARGEWAVIGHLPGGHWITLSQVADTPEHVRDTRLLGRHDAIDVRDRWASDINEAKIEGARAEATERLATLREWRKNHPTRTTWTADAIIPRVREMGEEERARFLKAIREINPGDLVVMDKDVTYTEIDQAPEVKGYYSSRPEVIVPHEGCRATATVTNGGSGYHPAAIHTLKAADTAPPDPIFHCPRCGREAPRSDWGHFGIDSNNDDDLRCPACWIEARSVIPLKGLLPVYPHTTATGGEAGAREIADLDAIVDRYQSPLPDLVTSHLAEYQDVGANKSLPPPPQVLCQQCRTPLTLTATRISRSCTCRYRCLNCGDAVTKRWQWDGNQGKWEEDIHPADDPTWRDRAIAEPLL